MCLFLVYIVFFFFFFFFFSSRRRHTRFDCDWSSDVCSSDLKLRGGRHSGVRVLCVPALPALISPSTPACASRRRRARLPRSEERRVGKECRSRWSTYHYKEKEGKRRSAEMSSVII